MRQSSLLRGIGLLLIFFASCGKDNSTNDPKPDALPITGLTLAVSLSKQQITANGTEESVITVKNNLGADVTAGSTFYAGTMQLTRNAFSTSAAGSYQIRAVNGTASSPFVNLIANPVTAPPGSGTTPGAPIIFTQKLVAEFFTGTWCGICPGTLIPMDAYTAANPNTIMVGIHGPNGSNDPYTYVFDSQLRNKFGVSGVPAVLINRNGFWDGKTESLDRLLSKQAQLGIALESSVSGNSIQLKAKVKFGETISQPLKLVVQLVEDDLVHDQANYGHFGLPNPITGFSHQNVLRSSATDVFGDAIPVADQVKGSTWEKSLSLNASGYSVTKCRVVAFVIYGENSAGLKGALNAQVVDAGKTILFD